MKLLDELAKKAVKCIFSAATQLPMFWVCVAVMKLVLRVGEEEGHVYEKIYKASDSIGVNVQSQ